MESEKKLRLTSLLGLKSARYGEVKFHFDDLKDLKNDIDDSSELDPIELDSFRDFFEDEDFLEMEIPYSGLIYVCGHVTYKLRRKLECQECVSMFLSDEKIDDQYFQEIDRGGLCVPTDLCFQMGRLALLIMQRLISSKYEASFIICSNQRKILLHLLQESLPFLNDYFSHDDKCSTCDTTPVNNFYHAFKIFSNILLNNYSKCKNNTADSAHSSSKTSKTLPSKNDSKVENSSSKTSKKLSSKNDSKVGNSSSKTSEKPSSKNDPKIKSSAMRKLSTLKK